MKQVIRILVYQGDDAWIDHLMEQRKIMGGYVALLGTITETIVDSDPVMISRLTDAYAEQLNNERT